MFDESTKTAAMQLLRICNENHYLTVHNEHDACRHVSKASKLGLMVPATCNITLAGEYAC